MKTPDEIKKGLDCCQTDASKSCKPCPYVSCVTCISDLNRDALAYIQQLERERNAAVEDISEAAKTGCLCYVCHHNDKGSCKAFDRGIFEATVMCGQYKWRGVQK